jgi:hypothetical protein
MLYTTKSLKNIKIIFSPKKCIWCVLVFYIYIYIYIYIFTHFEFNNHFIVSFENLANISITLEILIHGIKA